MYFVISEISDEAELRKNKKYYKKFNGFNALNLSLCLLHIFTIPYFLGPQNVYMSSLISIEDNSFCIVHKYQHGSIGICDINNEIMNYQLGDLIDHDNNEFLCELMRFNGNVFGVIINRRIYSQDCGSVTRISDLIINQHKVHEYNNGVMIKISILFIESILIFLFTNYAYKDFIDNVILIKKRE